MVAAPRAGQLLELLLELQTRQLAPLVAQVGEVLKPDFGHQTRVGEGRRAAAGRHAVDHRLRGVGHRRDDEAAGTHAEGVDAAPGLLADKRIGRRRKILAAPFAVVLDGVDERLGVLDAHAHGEGLRLEPHAAARQQLVDVARRVSRGEDDSRRLDAFVAAAHPCEASAAQFEVGHPPLEEELPPGVENRLPDGPHDVGQAVGTDVGVRLVENRGVGAVEDQRLERLAVIAALLAAREELAVGEGPRAALAEGVVRIGVDRPVAVDLRDVALAGRDVAPALENHRTQPQLDEAQRGEEPMTSTSVRPATEG